MIKVRHIATPIAAALALGYGASASAFVAMPGAAAEGMFTLSTFRICAGDGIGNGSTAASCVAANAATGNGTGLIAGVNLTGTEEAGAAARVNGLSSSVQAPLAALGSTFSATATIGAGFTPGTPIPALAPTGQYAGAQSLSSGFALSPAGANVLLHSQTELNTYGSDSSAASEQTLSSTFFFSLAQSQTFELSFDATKKLRAGLGQFGISADGDTSLSFAIQGISDPFAEFAWEPGGSAGGISCAGAGVACTEFSDGFNLQNGVSIVFLPIDIDLPLRTGYFEAELTLPAGTYSFNISGQTQANAAIIPEPNALALLGLGLLGLGVSLRRKIRG